MLGRRSPKLSCSVMTLHVFHIYLKRKCSERTNVVDDDIFSQRCCTVPASGRINPVQQRRLFRKYCTKYANYSCVFCPGRAACKNYDFMQNSTQNYNLHVVFICDISLIAQCDMNLVSNEGQLDLGERKSENS